MSYPKDSGILHNAFQISFSLGGTEDGWTSASEVSTCLPILWTQIETERTNSIPSPAP